MAQRLLEFAVQGGTKCGVVERIPRTIGAMTKLMTPCAPPKSWSKPIGSRCLVWAAFETKHWERKRDLGWIAQVGTSDRFVGVGFE